MTLAVASGRKVSDEIPSKSGSIVWEGGSLAMSVTPSLCNSSVTSLYQRRGSNGSQKVNISFDTTSVSAPIERAKSDVSSKIGGRISTKLKDSKTSRAVCSNQIQSEECG